MALPLVPGSQEIHELVASHVRGPYRWVQHAWVPYVRIGPVTETEPITIKSSARLRLLKSRSARLIGITNTMDFTIIYDDDLELHLVQTPFHATQLDPYDGHTRMVNDKAASPPSRSIHFGAPVWENAREGGESLAQNASVAPAPQKPSAVVNRPQQMTTTPASRPALHELPICDVLRDLAVREKLDPELGDYLVIPASQAQQYAPLPRWAATTTYVDQIYVVKPRLGMNQPVGSA